MAKRLERWLEGQHFWVVAVLFAFSLAVAFGVGMFDWWLAQVLSWWAFALLVVLGIISRVTYRMWRRWQKEVQRG